ncbi:MAG: RsmB/NOP family class I SAM-dependent RNA methyltransferase [Pseudobdellovibrionaceae bacterium]
MKIHLHLVEQVINCLMEIFHEQKHADKAIERLFKANSRWGARDRRFFAEAVYEIVRHRRYFDFLAFGSQKSFFMEESRRSIQRLIQVHLYLKEDEWYEFDQADKTFSADIVEGRLNKSVSSEVLYSFPDELANIFKKQFQKDYEQVLKSLNEPAQVYLRVNTLKGNLEQLKLELIADNIEIEAIESIPNCVRLKERKNTFNSQAFKKGLFEVQDAASQKIALLVDPQPSERICDACAGGGGKSLHLASLMKNKGKIIAMDIHEWKLTELKKRASRTGVDIIETKIIEGTKTIKRLEKSFDRVLLDVPCSGSGVFRRNPDAKWKVHGEDLERLNGIQKEILNDYAKMTKPKGILVYATCSLLESENQKQVIDFLASHPEWKLIKEEVYRPDIHGFDGFYGACLQRQ